MRSPIHWALLFVLILASRLVHSPLLWIEESYPAAAAIQMDHGKVIYRDFQFDKPPLAAIFYRAIGAPVGWQLRVAGAAYIWLCCWLAGMLALTLGTEREAAWAPPLMAVFLTFDFPAAVLALAPDLLMVAPHLAAVLFTTRKRPILAGLCAGIALGVHVKGLFVILLCMLWRPAAAGHVAMAAAVASGGMAGWLAWHGALVGYLEQVWAWGMIYSSARLPETVLKTAARPAAWLAFHAALAFPAGLWLWRTRLQPNTWRLIFWIALSAAAVAAGGRFFPRYFFQLLPSLVIAAALAMPRLHRRQAAVVGLLALIPIARFGPRYVTLGADLIAGRETQWADLAMFRDSQQAARELELLGPGSVLVWGYRPDLLHLTRRPVGSGALDSQPYTGVLADRHLATALATAPEVARQNRERLVRTQPRFIIDGLGPYNPELAITSYPDLRGWLAGYREVARTTGTVIFQRR